MRELTTKHGNTIITAIAAFKAVAVTGNDLYNEAERVASGALCCRNTAFADALHAQKFASDVVQDILDIADIQVRMQTLFIRAAKRAEAEHMREAGEQLAEATEEVARASKLVGANKTALIALEDK
jgi:hypothetical protein